MKIQLGNRILIYYSFNLNIYVQQLSVLGLNHSHVLTDDEFVSIKCLAFIYSLCTSITSATLRTISSNKTKMK